MKLLLTSGGLTTDLLKNEFLHLVDKPASEINIAFITTAANVQRSTRYVRRDLENVKSIGIKNIQPVDIAHPRVSWEQVLRDADVVWVEGGNTFYLLGVMRKSGLDKDLKELMKDKVYVGVSAGSIIATPTIAGAFIEPGDRNDVGLTDLIALAWVSFEVCPHMISSISLENVSRYAEKSRNTLYAFDDTCAVQVVDTDITFLGNGFKKIFNSLL